MTSKQEQSCYVYITLPNETEATTAARFVITNQYGEALGKLVYGKNYLERKNAVELDPVVLKLSSKIYETTSMNGIFGSLRDAGPDYWGRLLVERYSGKNLPLSEMDYLLESPEDRVGALGFGLNKTPPSPFKKYNKIIKLAEFENQVDKVIKNELLPPGVHPSVQDFMSLTSLGGARPKYVFEHNDHLWIAKFNRRDDPWNVARVEHGMLKLSQKCGINTAHSEIWSGIHRDILMVKRFDREISKEKKGYFRSRMISALTMLQISEEDRTKWSYINLVEELRRICHQPNKNAKELFHRMCFNSLVSNTDDHPRNHAFLAKETKWGLSPAYDIVPSPSHSQERQLAMICGDKGRLANFYNLTSQHARFCLHKEEAVQIIHNMEETIKSEWYSTMRESGVTEEDCNKISTAFEWKGFRFSNI